MFQKPAPALVYKMFHRLPYAAHLEKTLSLGLYCYLLCCLQPSKCYIKNKKINSILCFREFSFATPCPAGLKTEIWIFNINNPNPNTVYLFI